MAHSLIFEITENPYDVDEWIEEDTFFESDFIGSVAEYVSDTTIEERPENIARLRKFVGDGFEVAKDADTYTIKVLPGGKQKYFKSKFRELKAQVGAMTVEDYCDEMNAWRLMMLISDKFSLYVYQNGTYRTIDNFVRNIAENRIYYIGGIVGYKY